jgi:hypothetical protein
MNALANSQQEEIDKFIKHTASCHLAIPIFGRQCEESHGVSALKDSARVE